MDPTQTSPGERTYANPVMRAICEKHSIRSYTDAPIDDTTLRAIVEAGLRAPSALGAQPTTLLVCRDAQANRALGRLSRSLYDEGVQAVSRAQPSIADDPTFEDAFYGAPVVVHCFVPCGYSYAPVDASMVASNMMTAAWSFGVGSCFVSRARQLFEVGWARDFAREHGIPDDLEGAFHLTLGYAATDAWSPKPQRPGRLHWC